jgi:Family of unknown function (DUF6084)
VALPVIPELGAIPELQFSIQGAEALTRAAVPTVALRLAVARTGGSPVRSATVAVRVDIAPARRAYDAEAEARLVELFGEPERWGTTLHGLGWARATVLVGPFDDRTTVELPLACSYDFEVAAAKYLHALRDGEIPLDLMFSGSVLYQVGDRIQAAPIPWDREATYRLPVRVWREAMDTAFPDSAWLRLQRDTFDRLYAYRARRALPSWEETIEALLGEEDPWTR